MFRSVKKTCLWAAMAGFFVALSLWSVNLYRYHHGLEGPVMPVGIVLWLWPTAAWMIDVEENATGWVIFVISALSNGLIYGLGAFVSPQPERKLLGLARRTSANGAPK